MHMRARVLMHKSVTIIQLHRPLDERRPNKPRASGSGRRRDGLARFRITLARSVSKLLSIYILSVA